MSSKYLLPILVTLASCHARPASPAHPATEEPPLSPASARDAGVDAADAPATSAREVLEMELAGGACKRADGSPLPPDRVEKERLALRRGEPTTCTLTDAGSCVCAEPPAPSPGEVAIGPVVVSAGPQSLGASAARTLLDARARFAACYRHGLEADPSIEGELTLEFRVASDGTVSSVRSTARSGLSPEVERCVLSRARGVDFDGGAATLQVTLSFRRAR